MGDTSIDIVMICIAFESVLVLLYDLTYDSFLCCDFVVCGHVIISVGVLRTNSQFKRIRVVTMEVLKKNS